MYVETGRFYSEKRSKMLSGRVARLGIGKAQNITKDDKAQDGRDAGAKE